jgi:F-type H+-transporting ATPase subunit gamma
MANLKEIRNRITSVGSTMQITSAMKMVSAAKLKRAQDAITQMRPYAEKLQEILGNLSGSLDLSENSYSEVREVKNVLIVGVTSNRGLCGGFNNNIMKRVNFLINDEYKDVNVKVLGLGKKIREAYKKTDLYYVNEEIAPVEDIFSNLNFANTATIAASLMDRFKNREFDKVIVVYNKFINAAVQDVRTEQLLPIESTVSESDNAMDYIFEPTKEEIVSDLIPKSLKIQLYKGLLDSYASEHGARMTAMHKATDNAAEMKKNLTLGYNKARQAAITSEILEIVGGAEALNN